jgi:hypothetical protein
MTVLTDVPTIPHPSEDMDRNAQTLAALLDALSELGASHAIIGGLAAGYYGKKRSTVDVDLLVSKRFLKRLGILLHRRGYDIRAHPNMIRVYLPGEHEEAVADIVEQEANPILHAAFAVTVPARLLGFPVSLVQRGAFVALKFHAAVSPTRRRGDRAQDVVDIVRVLEKSFGEEDEQLALNIVAKMHEGAVEEFRNLVADIRHGRPLKI